MKFSKKMNKIEGVLHSRAELKLTISWLSNRQVKPETTCVTAMQMCFLMTSSGSQVLCLMFHSFSLSISFSPSHFPPAFLSSHYSVFLHRQTGGVRSGQVISGLIGRLMLLQKPGTFTCLLPSLMHFLPNSKSQTCWRLTETQTTVAFGGSNKRRQWKYRGGQLCQRSCEHIQSFRKT